MEPIISPWLIYLLGIVDGLRGIFICSSIIIGLGTLTYIVFRIIIEIEGNDGEKKTIRKFSFAPYLLGILILFAVLIPSKEIIIGMIVAQNITPNNVKKAVEVGKDFKNEIKKDVVDIIQSITKETKEKP